MHWTTKQCPFDLDLKNSYTRFRNFVTFEIDKQKRTITPHAMNLAKIIKQRSGNL